MSKIDTFEDIEGWQLARELTAMVYHESATGEFAKDFALKDQIRRASVSVMSNIAEGFGRGGNAEMIQFLTIARGSVAEVQAQLYVALDNNYLSKEAFEQLYQKSDDCARRIGGFIRYLKQSNLRGPKYK